jgi:hypothetical protein
MLGKNSPWRKCGLAILAFICSLGVINQSAFAGGQVPFRAIYSLQLEASFALPIATVTSQGAGLATHLGVISTRSVSETVNLATGEGIAVHEFTAANGDVLRVSFHFLAIPTSPTHFDVNGVWEITSGTGRFEGATGAGSYKGDVDFTSATTADGTFELRGTISSPGSSK